MLGADWEVPSYRALEIESRQALYAIAVFVINEGHRLLELLDRMRPYSKAVDVVVADGGSSDGSTERSGLASRG